MSSSSNEISFPKALIAGGFAGFAVDVSLFPLDTLKTRLQSPQGFIKAGGFKGIYKGLSAAALGSAPGAALFFSTYETSKALLKDSLPLSVTHMVAASCGEVIACLIRVPTEVVKQRYQANMIVSSNNLFQSIGNIFKIEGLGGFYKGFGITIMREIPFSLVQFPMYEYFKSFTKSVVLNNKRDLYAYESAIFGSISGGIAAAVTTPLDVMKTRLMLGKDKHGIAYEGVIDTFTKLNTESIELFQSQMVKSQWQAYRRVFFAGVEPRVMWISIGGFVFFGAYEQAKRMLMNL